MSTISSENIISILRSEIENYEIESREHEVGTVIWVGDGIATIYGMEHAMYGEIVIFENGVKGMVQDIKQTEIGCIILGKDTGIREGMKVTRTKKRAGIPVGEHYLGRVVNALGAPIDGKGDIEADDYRPIECDAPGIVDRKSVSVPLETGILSIDSMFPIGRGQRELIIGDRQTGKTSIAMDAILNQKGKDVICIFVAIGQKASTVAKLVNTLEKNDALDYSIVVTATASESASLEYIAPYSGVSRIFSEKNFLSRPLRSFARLGRPGTALVADLEKDAGGFSRTRTDRFAVGHFVARAGQPALVGGMRVPRPRICRFFGLQAVCGRAGRGRRAHPERLGPLRAEKGEIRVRVARRGG